MYKSKTKAEKERLDARVNPVELFNESLPQLVILNLAMTGLIISSDIGSAEKQEALSNSFRMFIIQRFITDLLYSPFADIYDSSFQEKQILVQNIPSVYKETEIRPLMDNIDVAGIMYEVGFCAAYFSLFMFMMDGPIPLIDLKYSWKIIKSLFNNRGFIVASYISLCNVWNLFLRITSICFAPLRQISLSSLIFSTYYVMEDGQIFNANFIFWTKICIFLGLVVLPCLGVQYYYLYSCKSNCSCSQESVWCKMPFVYGISMFTGIFISKKELKRYKMGE